MMQIHLLIYQMYYMKNTKIMQIHFWKRGRAMTKIFLKIPLNYKKIPKNLIKMENPILLLLIILSYEYNPLSCLICC